MPTHAEAPNPMSFTASNDLLAMLPLSSTDPSQTSQKLQDGELSVHPVELGLTAPTSREIAREPRRAPFDISDFPALAGHASLPQYPRRDSLGNEISGLSLPFVDNETTCGAGNFLEIDTLASPDLNRFPCEVFNNDELAARRLLQPTSLEYSQDGGSNFAMQSEDFPALPGTQRAPVSYNPEIENNLRVPKEEMQHSGLSLEPTAKLSLASTSEDRATMQTLQNANSKIAAEFSKTARVLQIEESVVSMAQAPTSDSSCASNRAFDSVPDSATLHPRARPSSRLTILDVGLVSQARKIEGLEHC